MTKILTVEQMRALEAAVDASGLTYAQMMENAGSAVAKEILTRWTDLAGKRVVILVGAGNNGGDGLVVAHHLATAGAHIAVYLTKPRPEDDPNLARLKDRQILIATADQDQRSRVLRNLIAGADLLVDALLGTGFRLPLQGVARDVLATTQKAIGARTTPFPVVALDCPSGLDCDSGEVAHETLKAVLTVTLAAVKTGLLRFPGAEYVGSLAVGDIGIAPDHPLLRNIDQEMATRETVRRLLPPRPRNSHKGMYGRLLIVAGSVNYPGAAGLSGMAAYRVGAGLVSMAVPAPVQALVAPRLPEATWILLPHELGVISENAIDVLSPETGKAQAFLIGPGLGQDESTGRFVSRLLGKQAGASRAKIGFVHPGEEGGAGPSRLPPSVVDADGLKLLVKIPEWQACLPDKTVLTPHPGEMAVMTETEKDAIQADRVSAAQHWAREWGHVVALKGAFTVVASPEGKVTVMPFATSALAKAGTGDVLAGAIAGLRAQGVLAFEAAVLGCYLQGRAGELSAGTLGTEASVLAGEVADHLAHAMAELGASDN